MKTKSIFLACVMAFGIVMGVNAQEAQQSQETKTVTVATVNIYNAALINQSPNGELTIVFDLNNREGIQSNIKYAVNLIQEAKDKSILMDQQVYDEEITLGQNETKQKKIIYAPPYFLNGTYKLMVEARNSDGLILGLADAGTVLLSGSGQNVIIYQDSCYLTIDGDKENKHYTLTQGVDLKPEENISLNCQIENNTQKDINVTPNFTTFHRSTFGKQLDRQTAQQISLAKGEKTLKTFPIPKQTTPQAYDTTFSLNDESSNPISEKITAHYVIAGQSASIQNVQFDKNSYNQGETAKLSFFYSGSASNFPNARNNQQKETLNVEINIQDQDNKTCAPIFKKELAQEAFKTFDIAMTQNCTNPTAQVMIKDKDGKVLAQNSFGTTEKTTKSTTPTAESTDDWGTGAKAALLGAAVLAFIILIAIFTKKRKGKALIWMLAFVLVGLAMGEGAKGDTFVVYGSGATAVWTINLNKSTYEPSGSMTVSSSVVNNSCSNQYSSVSAYGTVNGKMQEIGNQSGTTNNYWTVQKNVGAYKAIFVGELYQCVDVGACENYSNGLEIGYSVVAPPVVVNGSCGSANGGSFASAPTAGLCSAGTATSVTGSGPWNWSCKGSGGGSTANCSANKTTTCTVSSWSPATSTVCSGTSFTQTNNCGGSRSATGTKSCTCTPTSWSPDPSTVCSGTAFTQTSNCSTTRSATGTKGCTCTPTTNCAPNTCVGSTCWNGCAWVSGTKPATYSGHRCDYSNSVDCSSSANCGQINNQTAFCLAVNSCTGSTNTLSAAACTAAGVACVNKTETCPACGGGSGDNTYREVLP